MAVQPTIPLKGNIGSVVSFALSLGPHDTNTVHNTHTLIIFCYYVSLGSKDITMDISF